MWLFRMQVIYWLRDIYITKLPCQMGLKYSDHLVVQKCLSSPEANGLKEENKLVKCPALHSKHLSCAATFEGINIHL